MAASVGVLKNSILLGQVIPSTLTKAVKVQVPYFVYDDLLKAYFKKTQDFVAQDGTNDCKTGDLVIISKLDKTEKREITHCVTERVFRLGDIRDPISGEMVVGTQYRYLLHYKISMNCQARVLVHLQSQSPMSKLKEDI